MEISLIYAVLSMFLFGGGVLFYKLGTSDFSTGLGIVIFLLSHLIVIAFILPFEKFQFGLGSWKFLVIGGILGGFGQLAFFNALKIGDTNVVVPIRNLAVLVTVVLAVIFLGESLTVTKGIGVVMAVGAILLLSV